MMWWTASKDLPKGFLNAGMSVNSHLQETHPGACMAPWSLNPPSRAFRTINHDGLTQTRNSQRSGFLQLTDTPFTAGKLAFQKPRWIVLVEKPQFWTAKERRAGRQQHEYRIIDIKFFLAQCENQISFIKFCIRRWEISKEHSQS